MMKKGFTLAEVLITLTIIGVVAVLTLPGLMSNTAEQQARAALKKMVNTFSQAAEMNASIAGYNYAGIVDGSSASYTDVTDDEVSLLKMFSERLDIDRAMDKPNDPPAAADSNVTTFLTNSIAVYLKDGTAIYFSKDKPDDTKNFKTQSDGLMKGIPVLFDTNGSKGPDMISSCWGKEAESFTADNTGDCKSPKKRFIKDIFMMNLRDSSVQPIGSASTWMIDDSIHTAPTLNQWSES